MKIRELKAMSQPERLVAFTEWVGTQPRNQPYDFMSVSSCALAQYGRSFLPRFLRWVPVSAGGCYFSLFGVRVEIFPTEEFIFQEPQGWLIDEKTMGALYDRLAPLVLWPRAAYLDAIERRPLVDSAAVP